jgi:hypothetical protein
LLVFRVPAFGSGPATGSRVFTPRRSVKSSGIPRRTQRRRPDLHSLGTTCGIWPNPGSRRAERPVLEWGAQRWKAPRVRRIAVFFAEGRERRPSGRCSSPHLLWPAQAVRGGQGVSDHRWASRESGSFGEPSASGLVRRVRDGHARFTAHLSAAKAPPAIVAASSRHEVLERIGSGRSFRREQSRRRAPGGRKPPGPWPVKPRLEPFRKEWNHPKPQVRRGLSWRARGPVPTGPRARRGSIRRRGVAAAVSSPFTGRRARRAQSPRRAERGSGDRAVVLAECFDCRSRRAALGPFRLTAAGLALPLSGAMGERASEAGSRRQSCENGGGLPSRPGTAGCAFAEQFVSGQHATAGWREHSSMEGVLVRGSSRL